MLDHMVKILDYMKEAKVTIRTASEAVVHSMHGSTFTSFVAPALGSAQLCAWRLDVPPDTEGVEHRVTHEEVLLVLAGELRACVDGRAVTAVEGEVVVVPPGGLFRVDTGPAGVSAWVVTSVGLEAVASDGQHIAPPWVR